MKIMDVDKHKTTFAVIHAVRNSGCDGVISGQGVSISDTGGCAASCSTSKRGYFPVVNQLKYEIIDTTCEILG